MKREKFGSRLGFLLISAGCAIGIGNVWRFPYVTGMYGGAAFVLIYLFFLIILGLPIMTMEFAVGRASQKSAALSFQVLEPKNTKWHLYSYGAILGNYLLMMFYTTVGGWMLHYFIKTVRGDFAGLSSAQVGDEFTAMLANPKILVFWMIVVILLGFGICCMGLKNGVERITKTMMCALLIILVVLAINSVMLDGGKEGLAFYLIPDFKRMMEVGFLETVVAAMGQAFFTLSLGIGAMAIFGSYIGKERRLFGESVNIAILDTFVALMSGLIIFPACSAFGVSAGTGPGLVFVTLPNVFNEMSGGQIWGSLFFIFMSFASLSTIIAVFENIISFGMDLFHWSRKKSVIINLVAVTALSLPCALGFNVLSFIAPFGAGSTIQDLEDFIVSNTLLPIGSLVYLLFCVNRYGWGFKNFMQEANIGKGLKFPIAVRFYVTFILPAIVIFLLVQGYYAKFVG